jgi:outer membrane protein
VVPEVDFTYFVTDNIALELIAGTTRHDVSHTPTGIDLGKVSLLPPTLTLQYHFMPKERLSPYVGAGVNYTIFYNEDAPGGAVTSIDYDNSFGWALQAGVDYAIADRWYVNLDVKKLFLSTDVSINGGAINAKVDLDPWLFGVGVGYRF